MSDANELLAGKIGLGLSLCLWILSSWRLIFHTLIRRRPHTETSSSDNVHDTMGGGEQQQHRALLLSSRSSFDTAYRSFTQWFTRRRTFHILLWMATSCEALAYADLSGVLSFSKNRVFADKLGYVLLDVSGRSVLELLAFSQTTAIWLKTAIESSPAHLWGSARLPFGLLPPVFVVVIVFLVLASVSLSAVALVLFQDDDLDTIQKLRWTRAQTMLEAAAWGIHSLVVMECVVITSKRVLNLVPSSQWSQRMALLTKAVLPMLCASLVYATRCTWLVAVFCCHIHQIERGTWQWYIGFVWAPTWLAVGVLLYSARKRDALPNPQQELQQPLLRPRPPAEAFLAFSQHRHGLDVDDSFSFCRSPIIHVVTHHPDDMEAADAETLSTSS